MIRFALQANEEAKARFPGYRLSRLVASRLDLDDPDMECFAQILGLDQVHPSRGRGRSFNHHLHHVIMRYGLATLFTAIFRRIGEKYYTLKDDSSTPHDTIVAVVTAVAQPDPDPANIALELIYRHMPPEYRSVVDGKKFILVLRTGEGTCLVQLTGLTDAEIADNLPYAVEAEARQLGKDAYARHHGAAPVLDKRCMDLVRDLNPSGEIGTGHTSIISKSG